MQSSLWKLGALLGVIGVGFLVLLKAQQGMTTGEQPPELFNELAVIEELGDAGEPLPIEPPQRTALADAYQPEHTPVVADGPPPLEPLPEGQAEPTPAATATGLDQTASAGQSVNPFAAFSFDSPEDPEPTPQPQADPEPAEDDEPNPFANLVRSFTDDADETVHEVEATTVAADDELSPFSASADAGDEPTPVQEPRHEFDSAPPSESLVRHDESPEAVFPQSEPEQTTRAPKQYEPTALMPVPEDAPGPTLMSPPPAATELPSPAQQAEPALVDATDDEAAAAATELAQTGVEQPAPWADEPSPGLVFPGSEAQARPEPARSAQQDRSELPVIDPQGTTGAAWLGDFGSEAPPQDPVQHPDGTIEMTIKPRGSEEPRVAPTPHTQPAAQQTQDDFNPFGTVPEQSARNQPAPTATIPAPRPIAYEPRFRDPGLSFSKGPIQPAGAETSASPSSHANSLTPADFVGVGTISPDTPATPQQAQLTIEKQAPNDAVLGQDLIYNILVKNIGRSPAKNVVVEDLVPKGSELKGTDPQAQMTPDKKLVWQLGTMEPGAQRTIRIKVVPTNAGQIGSVATVSFEAAVASRTVITAPELRLSMNGPTEVRIGEKAPYKYTLTNTGSADATNVFIRSVIPEGFEHPAARQQNGVTDIEYKVGMLPRGQSREVELTLLAVSSGDFQNRSILTADGNVNVEAHQPVRVIESRLKVHREGPANRFVGSQARFTNTVSNESSQPLRNVTITETVPMGVKFVQASDAGHYNAQQRTITWQLQMLDPGSVRRLQTIVIAEQPGQLATNVKAADVRGDVAQAASQLTVAGFSSLTVDVANPGRPIPVGEEVALRLKVRNGGTAAANAVETRIQLPRQLRFVSARGPVRYAQQGDWIAFEPINRIDVQGEQTFDVVLVAAEAADDARVVVQLTSDELSKPLSEDESVVIYADGP